MADFKITIATGIISAVIVAAILLATFPKDSDKDGLQDALEKTLGTNPNKWDTDGDNHCDSREHQEGTDPLDRNKVPLCCGGGGPQFCVKVQK
jgi:hypothetical protein